MKEYQKEKEPRVKELEDFANDFLKRLEDDEEEVKKATERPITEGPIENEEEKEKRKRLGIPDFSLEKVYKKKKNEPIVIIKNI